MKVVRSHETLLLTRVWLENCEEMHRVSAGSRGVTSRVVQVKQRRASGPVWAGEPRGARPGWAAGELQA
jgi:hypothetical protein